MASDYFGGSDLAACVKSLELYLVLWIRNPPVHLGCSKVLSCGSSSAGWLPCNSATSTHGLPCVCFAVLGRLLNDGELTSSMANHSSVACSEGYHTNPCGDAAAQSERLLQVSEKLSPNIGTKVRFQYCLDENC